MATEKELIKDINDIEDSIATKDTGIETKLRELRVLVAEREVLVEQKISKMDELGIKHDDLSSI